MSLALDRAGIRFRVAPHLWIPRRGRRAAAAGLSMHSACRRPTVLAQRLLYLGVRVVGSAVIPGRRGSWAPPLPEPTWDELLTAWRSHVGTFDALALYHRPQPGRIGFAALLLNRGRGLGFARVHPDPARIRHEFEVLTALAQARPTTFTAAKPVAHDRTGDGAWMLTESLPNYPLGAVRREATRTAVAEEIGTVLGSVLPRPEDAPGHWLPAHGDLAPWNLRTTLGGRVVVIDWEDAAYAPPGVDVLYGGLTAHATFGTALPRSTTPEARDWVDALLAARAQEFESPRSAAAEPNAALRTDLGTIPTA